ncbi:MAG: ArsB/NhaD family transporter [Candidatus Omnitrophica bacterium]|nr:ArsB/NhaD family transporter [Candidatus Omnitrophota bacterium]
MNGLYSVILFITTYCLIASEKINKTIVTIIAAGIAILCGLISFEEAVSAVDFNVIFLLVGMMVSVHILSKTGFFEWIAISLAKQAKGEPLFIMLFLLIITALLSAFLDNVTTIILIVPVTILIAQILEINPQRFIILEAIASNIGGTATLIGDPPNIVIGSHAKLSFNSFLINLGPAILFVFAAFLISVVFISHKNIRIENKLKERVLNALPHLAIIDPKNMKRSLMIFGVMFAGLFFHEKINVEPGLIAIVASMIMLFVCKHDGDEVIGSAEWGVIFFFIGMFMLVASLKVNGVIAFIGKSIIVATGHNVLGICLMVLWGSAIFSAILDNIPFVIAMVPLIQGVIDNFSGQSIDPLVLQNTISEPLWWSLALGACLGGNGTLIGASANIVMARIAEKNNCSVRFIRFCKFGIPFTLQSLIITTLYIWLRYFIFNN